MRNLLASGDRLVGNRILADAAEKQPTQFTSPETPHERSQSQGQYDVYTESRHLHQ